MNLSYEGAEPPPADWPELRVEYTDELPAKYSASFTMPLAYTWGDLIRGICWIFPKVAQDWPAVDAHERMHCKGWSHPGDDRGVADKERAMREYRAWKQAQ